MYFKFRFFKEHASLLLTFHHAQTPQTLLAVINDFVVDTYGDMPASSISKYELYYYSGAFYNMVIHLSLIHISLPVPWLQHIPFAHAHIDAPYLTSGSTD